MSGLTAMAGIGCGFSCLLLSPGFAKLLAGPAVHSAKQDVTHTTERTVLLSVLRACESTDVASVACFCCLL